MILEDSRFTLLRNGHLEEAFVTYCVTPIRQEGGSINGVLLTFMEPTQKVLGERRTKCLQSISKETITSVKMMEETIPKILSNYLEDIPFFVYYAVDKEMNFVRRFQSDTLENTSKCSMPRLSKWEAEESLWPFEEVMKKRGAVVVEDVESKFGVLPGDDILCRSIWIIPFCKSFVSIFSVLINVSGGAWPEAPRSAMVGPIYSIDGRISGVLIMGASPRRPVDENYFRFFEMLCDHIANSYMSGRIRDEEQERIEALAEINQTKTTFFHNVSHEFRTPLSLMLGPLDDLLNDSSDPVTEGQKRKIEMVQRNSQRLLGMVNTLLDFSRIEAGKTVAQFEPVNVSDLTKGLCEVFRSVMEKAGLEYVVEIEEIEEEVYLDKEMWERIVFNLLSNAFKYTLRGRVEVRMSKKKDGSGVWMRVVDSGVGIPENELEKVFERFHRVEGVHGRSHEGTGKEEGKRGN